MKASKKTRINLYDLILIASPLWGLIASTVIALFIRAWFFPHTGLGENTLFLFFVTFPAIVSFFVGTAAFYRMLKLPNLGGLVLTIAYAMAAVFVEFFAGWWALMTLGV